MDKGKFNETQVTLIRSAKTIFMGVGSEKTGSEDFDKTRVGGTFKIKGGNKKRDKESKIKGRQTQEQNRKNEKIFGTLKP